MRMEIARMFGGWPHELLAVPVSEYRRLLAYYREVKEARAQGSVEDFKSDFE